jgi:hypothetical protein
MSYKKTFRRNRETRRFSFRYLHVDLIYNPTFLILLFIRSSSHGGRVSNCCSGAVIHEIESSEK